MGRYAGRKFTVLQQVENREEAQRLLERAKEIGKSLREVEGRPITLYLSVGYARYSEFLDMEEQIKYAEMRLHADYDQNISAESRIDHASEIFHLFDDLPVPYSVYHVTHAEHSGQYDAVFFYVNHKYEEFAELPAKSLLGHTVRELFPFLGNEWYQDIKLAALDGKIVEGEFDNPLNGKHYHFTARQIIYPGYCAVTCVEMPAINTRKHILIADDIESNRELLGDLLQEDYDIYYASDGVEVMEMLQKHKNEIALLILDLYMPNMSGRDVMARMQADEELMSIPVIVLTVDQHAELECLKMGAMDFIPKPYPDIEIVKARIAKCIELSANRDLIRRAPWDRLTGLFNPGYFYGFVNRCDQSETQTAFDAVVMDVNGFSVITAQYGRKYGDFVLRSIGSAIKKLMRKTGGIGCRRAKDTFLFYCPHQGSYEQLMRAFLADALAEADMANKISLRIGIYPNAQQEPEIELRFERAQAAADGVKDESGRLFGFWDEPHEEDNT